MTRRSAIAGPDPLHLTVVDPAPFRRFQVGETSSQMFIIVAAAEVVKEEGGVEISVPMATPYFLVYDVVLGITISSTHALETCTHEKSNAT